MLMSETEFNYCTPKYFRLRLYGMKEIEEQKYRNQWEIARWTAAKIMMPHLKHPIRPEKLARFSWEDVETDDIVATVSKYKDIFAKLTPPAEA